MGSALDDLIDLLELEPLEANLFRGLRPDEHHHPLPAEAVPKTPRTWEERTEPYAERLGGDMVDWLVREKAIDSRPTESLRLRDRAPRPPAQDIWSRAKGTLPDDPTRHACV